MAKKAIKCSKMFDSTNSSVKENVVILIDGDKIEAVVSAAEANCEGYEIIDLGDKFVTPGLIDAHVHLSIVSSYNFALLSFGSRSNSSMTTAGAPYFSVSISLKKS